ncbi:MAG: Glutamate-1-semialdehyde 2,1-aminomutase [Chlamydiae bacterium]|nr:Glutamate-1-semialdehyde 2,1-aminomutase [Chlamydiota bacterium]
MKSIGYFFKLTFLAVRLRVYSSRTERNKLFTRFGSVLAEWLIASGPFYIKIGQILSTRSDLLPKEIIDSLRVLQDNVPPMDHNSFNRALRTAYGANFNTTFASIDKNPIASASIAQVHEAYLHDGEHVAVKIVRPGTRARFQKNLRLFRRILPVVELFSRNLKQLHCLKRLDEVESLLLEQTDMEQELRNQQIIRDNFQGHAFVRVPRLYPDYCTKNVLVMEYVDALPGLSHKEVEIPSNKLARRFQDAMYTMVYHHGICHGDPHPGNIFFSKKGEIIMLDFGITVHLTEDEKWALSSFYYACTRREWDIAVERFTKWFVENAPESVEQREEYHREMRSILVTHFNDRTERWSTVAYIKDINQLLRSFGARSTYNFTKVELVLFSTEGFVCDIDPEIDVWENARKFTDRYSPFISDSVSQRFDTFFKKQIPRSMELREEAKRSLIAPTHLDRYFFPSEYPLFIERAEGSRLYDVDGNEYVDLSCGYGPHILGYAPKSVTESVENALQNGSVNALGHNSEVILSQMLVDAFPAADLAIFSNSGTEAVIQAVRICRAVRGGGSVVKFEGHYHGFSDQGLVSSWFRFRGATSQPEPIRTCLGQDESTVDSTIVLQYGFPEALLKIEERHREIACVILEPMHTSLCKINHTFLQGLKDLCNRFEIPLVFDEVVTGFRVCYGGIQNKTGIQPDLTCLGKIIGGGLPAGAVVGRARYLEMARTTGDPFKDFDTRTFVGGTMSGNSLSCTAGIATLSYLKSHPEVYEDLERWTSLIIDKFQQIADKYDVPFRIRGHCSILAMTFNSRSSEIYRTKLSGSNYKANIALSYYMRKHGIYLPELHTLMLNAAHTDQDIEKICSAFDQSLLEMVKDGFFVEAQEGDSTDMSTRTLSSLTSNDSRNVECIK